ncbi:Luciferase-like monooxygenase OS=Streptomyces microflavus OX=1919 GN=Smic_73560 PE=4 SV=1 [Streptomyces microflavus]
MQVAGPGPAGSIDFYQRELDARIRQPKPNNARA